MTNIQARGLLQKYANTVEIGMRCLDLIGVIFSAFLSYCLLGISGREEYYLIAILLALLIMVFLFPGLHLYEAWRGHSIISEIRTILIGWCLVLVLLIVLALISKVTIQYSRLWLGLWFMIASLFFITSRLILRYAQRWARSNGFNQRRLVIVGTGELAECVANRILKSSWAGFSLVGFFDDDPVSITHQKYPQPLLGELNDIPNYLSQNRIDQVWLAIPWIYQEKLQKALHNLRFSTTDVYLVPDLFSYHLLSHSLSIIVGLPLLNLSTSPIKGLNLLAKNVLDWILALIIIIIMSPVMLAIAVGVKLSSPGPIFFRQIRYGLNGREVEVWKFRTMKMHQEKGNHVTQATKNDLRVTSFGSFLRRTSLDELPQFINVLQGRMSIVGPRPHAVSHNHYYKTIIDRYMLRHRVKPGITGWAQVNGYRGETDTLEKMQQRVKYDLEYIENWSLGLDLKIIWLTIFKGFSHKNAY